MNVPTTEVESGARVLKVQGWPEIKGRVKVSKHITRDCNIGYVEGLCVFFCWYL